MAAGQGFKTFTTGEVLSAADVNGYLMQGVLVFASSAARDAAVTSPQEGQFAYLKDTNVTTYYTGSAWANLDTTGMTNPMTTTGDTIYSSSGSTPARLGIGTTGQVLTVASGVPSWATPAGGGGLTLIASGSAAGSATTVSITSIPATYKDLYLIVRNFRTSVDGRAVAIRFNGDSATRYVYSNSDFQINGTFNASSIVFGSAFDDTVTTGLTSLTIPDYTNTTTWKMLQGLTMGADNGTPTNCKAAISFGAYNQTGAISQVDITSTSGNITCNYLLYGVN